MNVKVTITGDAVNLDPVDATRAMFIFINNRFEEIAPATFNFPGTAPYMLRG